MTDWYGASELADAYGTTGRTLAAWGRAYTDSGRSLQPILQREAPDEAPGQSKYVYRTDPKPRWPGDEVRELYERSGKVWRQLVKRVSCKMTALHELARTGGWASKKLQRELDQVADELLDDGHGLGDPQEPPVVLEDRWYAVCDDVCGRLVVSHTANTLGGAEHHARQHYTRETCDPVVVRGEGEAPETGIRLTDGDAIRLNV